MRHEMQNISNHGTLLNFLQGPFKNNNGNVALGFTQTHNCWLSLMMMDTCKK